MRLARRRCKLESGLFTVVIGPKTINVASRQNDQTPSPNQHWRRAQCLSDLLRRVLATEPHTIIVHLETGDDANTALLAVLVEAKSRARRTGADLITHASPALHRLAELCRLEHMLFSA